MSDAQPATPDTRYERFDTEAGFQTALDRLLEQSGRELRIFDPDLASLRLRDPLRIEQLERFLLASRRSRIFIVVHDTGLVTGHLGRMMRLLTRFAHTISVNRTHEQIRELQDAFIVMDDRHYVRRPVARFYRGAIGLNDENEAQGMRSRFGEIWSASYPAVAPTTIGL